MDEIFRLETEICNHIRETCELKVEKGFYCPLPSLPPGKTRAVKLSQILRCCRERRSSDWLIRVLVDRQFTGLQFKACNLISSVRIIIQYEIRTIPRSGQSVQLRVINAVQEKPPIDCLFRLKAIGPLFGRNFFWNKRKRDRIGQETGLPLPRANASPVRKFIKDNDEQKEAVMMMRDHIKKIRQPLVEKEKSKTELIFDNNIESELESDQEQIPVLGNAAAEESTTEESSSIASPLSGQNMEPARNGKIYFRGTREQMMTMEDDPRPQMDSFVNLLLFVFAICIVGFAKVLLK